MKLVPEAVAEVVNFKAYSDNNTAREAGGFEEEYIMVVIDAESNMEEAIGIIQVTDVSIGCKNITVK